MIHRILLMVLIVLTAPVQLAAFDHAHRGTDATPVEPDAQPEEVISHAMRVRLGLPVRLPLRPELREQIRRSRDARRIRHHPPGPGPVVSTTTIVNEVRPIVVVTPPAAAEKTATPEPQAEREWVPPVVETVTQPGYWDYAIKRTWMGDHWRYEQDRAQKTWIPATQVRVVTQAGYWRTVE
jgi:hypothetical protein